MIENAPVAASTLRRLVLVGAPNCGKTSLFNALTGSRQKVANYPGVTVERKAGCFATPGGAMVELLDVPGLHSMRGRSPDERVARDVILGHLAHEAPPDALICVADAASPRLGIRLVLELKRVGRPIILVLNMADIARHRGIAVDTAALSAALGIPVVEAVAVRDGGLDAMMGALDTLLDRLPKEAPTALPLTPLALEDLSAVQREADRIVASAVRGAERKDPVTSRVDAVLLHPVWGLVILLAILFIMFQAVFTGAKPLMDGIDAGFTALGNLTDGFLPDGLAKSFIKDGLIAGVGSVLVFLPQILILFLFILLFEDFGYMARAAFLMDRIMGGAGLHGRAFIPLLSSFACAIPGIMAARVIDGERDRLTTILVAPLMTCSARIPVYTLIIGAFVPGTMIGGWLSLQGLVMFGLYAVGILGALAVARIARLASRGRASEPFMIELPDYKWPRWKSVALGLMLRAKIFLRRAGTIIFAMAIVIWFLASFPTPPDGATGPAIDYSLAAMIGKAVQPLLAPIGFNWQISVALIPGMAAREVAVAALGTVYAVGGDGDNTASISQMIAGNWSLATALSLLAWYVFAPQCASTLAVIRREAGGIKWAVFAFVYMLALAWVAAFLTYRIAVWAGA